ncbi:general transcription factor II-I repeat domain-containing protein 2A [Trichonephila clavipes]|uniref:General transcription factor II-I repeat domain-containing protein 2A n=1 Tax=Trichonephila clavipes TaxID=2585209 RepID=A0A8X6WJL7_TRICX|nr:general transcription factor II-I repeat domain-containing protein 2A [Trichonephila clavipes]
MISKGDKAVCVLCSGTVVCRTSSIKRHFETNHKSFCEKSEPEQKELITSAMKDRNKQSTSIIKYISKNCQTSAASYSAANAIARHGVGHSILECHCIIHQQALCAKSGLTSLDNVITLVTKIDNLLSSQALNKRKFDALLDEINTVYYGLLMYNNARWLSRGNVLQRFENLLIAWKISDCFYKMRAKLNNTHS